MDRKEASIAVLLDMSAAFDTVDHDILLQKLENLGIRDDALNWLKMYMNDRSHSTCLGDILSDSIPLKMGVPQGSVLGPLLFTIYISDLGEIIQETGIRYAVYADDVQLLVNVKPSEFLTGISKIEECINRIQKWASNKYLKLNSAKTEFIVFGTKKQLSKIAISEIEINNVKYQLKSVVRNLGIFLDSQLQFSHHIDKICGAAYANLRMLQTIRSSMSDNQFAILSHALVLSRIESSPSLLYGVDDKQLKKLQRVIKATFRATYRFKRCDRIANEMTKRGWLSIIERILLRLLIILHTVITTGKPSYPSGLITHSSNEHALRSQSRGDLTTIGVRTEMGNRAFMSAAPRIWKQINVEMRRISKSDSFRSEVKKWLLQC
jgi:hypothetical protein